MTIEHRDCGGNVPGEAALAAVGIPACPAILESLRRQVACDDPDSHLIGRIVASDVALTAMVLRCVNSAAFGLSRKVGSLDQALSTIGARQLYILVTRLVMRETLNAEGPRFARVWDVSAKRCHALQRLARTLGCVDTDAAQTFGLFCDVGIVLLMQRFPGYAATLEACNADATRQFTDVERDIHGVDHAQVGALMARTWGVDATICEAIGKHHDYSVFDDPATPATVTCVSAMTLLADLAIQRHAGLSAGCEWAKAGHRVAGALGLRQDDLEHWVKILGDDFAAGHA